MVSRFDKYLNDDKTLVENQKEEKLKPSWQSNLFLVGAGVMLSISILSFIFQDEMMKLNGRESDFIYPLVFGVLFALFFLFAYRSKKIGLTLMGRNVELQNKPKESDSSPSYNMFKDETATDVKLQSSQRKKSRHLRKQFARQGVEKVSSNKKPSSD